MTADLQVHDEFITLDGLRFFYRDWGNPNAPPIVLLHGMSSQAHYWDLLAAALQDRYRLLALDQRGHGRTEWADDYAADRWVEDLSAFVTALALPPFVLIGHSMGAWIAWLYAARFPEAIQRLIIVDAVPLDPPTGPRTQPQDVWADWEEVVRTRHAQVMPFASEQVLRQLLPYGYRQLDDGRWTFMNDPRLRAAEPPPGFRPTAARSWEALRAITCPTLLVVGAEGALNKTYRPTVERVTREMADCRLVEIPAAGHPIPYENPDALLEAVQGFLARA